jgi:hypothetical protein
MIGLLLICGGVWGLYPQHVLRLEDSSNGKTIREAPARPGDNIWIVFINSVERLPVADHFVLNDAYQLIYSETIYQAPYAGYLHPERKELVAPGTIRIADFDRQMAEVTFFAGYEFKHMLFLNGNWIPLYQVAKGGDLIRITVKRQTRWNRLLNRISSNEHRQ